MAPAQSWGLENGRGLIVGGGELASIREELHRCLVLARVLTKCCSHQLAAHFAQVHRMLF